MMRHKVRVQNLGWVGFRTQADHYRDFDLESTDVLPDFAKRLAQGGFDDGSGKWIMHGAIMWIEPVR